MNKPLITFSDSSVAPEFDHPRPDRLVSGNPLRATRSHYEKPGMAAGIWSCETGAWNIAFADGKDEFFCVTEGRIRITDSSGAAKEFGPGDACVIPAGFTGTFEVLEPVKKYYVIVEPA